MAYALWYSRQLWNNQVMQRQNPSIWNNKYGFEPRMGNAVALGPESNMLNPVHIPYAQQQAQVYGPH